MAPETPEHPKPGWRNPLVIVLGLLLLGAMMLLALILFFGGVNLAPEGHEAAMLDIRNLQHALELFHSKHQRYPSTGEGIQVLVDLHYLERLPVDPWGRPYGYALREDQPVLWSHGADGVPGGSGLDADISSEW